MGIELKMPALSPTMEEGKLAKWLVKEGQTIKPGDIIAEIETDKATMEMQALSAGVLRKVLVQEGESAPLGQPIAIIGEPDEDGLSRSRFGTVVRGALRGGGGIRKPAGVLEEDVV